MFDIAADLHVHTRASDGEYSPEFVMAQAVARGMSAVSITDHDSIDGLMMATTKGKFLGVDVIPGVELSALFGDKEIHILGYYIDYQSRALIALLRELQKSRFERAEKIVGKLSAMGKDIDMEIVKKIAVDAAPGRTHIARALVERGYVQNVGEAFKKYVGDGKPAYVDRYRMTTGEAIAAIKHAGGMAVWAHPGLDETGTENFKKTLLKLRKEGLLGVEVYHPDHNEEQTNTYKKEALRRRLAVTGGSDYHGKVTGRGCRIGDVGLTDREYYDFVAFSKKRGKKRSFFDIFTNP